MRAYSRSLSVESGGKLELCVEPNKTFAIRFYSCESAIARSRSAPRERTSARVQSRQVDSSQRVYHSPDGEHSPAPDRDWNWPSIEFELPDTEWPSGVYIAIVYEVDANGEPLDDVGRAATTGAPIEYLDSNAALFVVRPRVPAAAIAYIVPIATFHAYNSTGGGCFYEYRGPHAPPLRTITLRRPGAGIGGISREPRDPYDPNSPRQSFAHWDGKIICWLRAHGFDVDCYTDLDLNQGGILAGHGAGAPPRYKLMLSAGHHEYWSEPMRDELTRFLEAGGNAAIFSGNTCYRKISFDPQESSITKENEAWPDSNEASLTGVSYSHGGGWWGHWRSGDWICTERPPIGYTVLDPGHWIFEGSSLSAGDSFGAPERLLGYECDGVVPDVSPAGLTVLAQARLEGGWNNGDGHTASMVIFNAGRGMVFNAATTDWARVLAQPDFPSYPALSRITHNVVSRLSGLSLL
jgi:hypothetical protein